jgi:hypothetical protein
MWEEAWRSRHRGWRRARQRRRELGRCRLVGFIRRSRSERKTGAGCRKLVATVAEYWLRLPDGGGAGKRTLAPERLLVRESLVMVTSDRCVRRWRTVATGVPSDTRTLRRIAAGRGAATGRANLPYYRVSPRAPVAPCRDRAQARRVQQPQSTQSSEAPDAGAEVTRTGPVLHFGRAGGALGLALSMCEC